MFYFKDDKQVTVYFANGDIAVWKVDNPMYEKIINLCIANEWIKIETLHNQTKMIMTSDKVSVNTDGNIVINAGDEDITLEHSSDPLLSLIKILKDKGTIDVDIEKAKPFLKNCLENSFIDAVNEIYEYCKAMDFEITEDGCFLAYKRVDNNYGSLHDSGRTKHGVGQYTEVQDFDTNRYKKCSQGLHFCSRSYLSSYSGPKVIIVKINPRDVVAIPTDYNFAKGRCRKYMMMGEMAADGTLRTTNIEAVTGEKVIKTKKAEKNDSKLAKNKAKLNVNQSGNRLNETAQWMNVHNNDVNKVAKIMSISPETVKRNLRKYNQRNKRNCLIFKGV